MKRLTLTVLLIALLCAVPALQAGISIGAFGGYNILLNDITGTDVTKGGVCYGGKIGFTLPLVTIGVLSGYFPVFNYKVEQPAIPALGIPANTYEYKSYAVPVLGFVQLNLGPIFLLGGAGMYASKTTTTIPAAGVTGSTESSSSSSDFGFALGAGWRIGFPMVPISFEIGGLYQSISTEGEATTMLSALAGVNLKF